MSLYHATGNRTAPKEERADIVKLFKIISIGEGRISLERLLEYYATMKGMAATYGPYWNDAADSMERELKLKMRIGGGR